MDGSLSQDLRKTMGLALSRNIYYLFLSVKVEKRGLLHFAAILHTL